MKNRHFNCQAKDIIVRSLSTSGGITGILANAIIEQGGIVYGAAFTRDFRRVEIDWVDNMHDYYQRIAKSKYVYSFLPKFGEIKEKLESGTKILMGMLPCQIVALSKFLGAEYPNLYLLALKCKGASSPKFFSDFIDGIESKNNAKLVSFDFRKNHRCSPTARFDNGKVAKYELNQFLDTSREECHSCKVKWDNKFADFIVGDYWEYKANPETMFDPSLTV